MLNSNKSLIMGVEGLVMIYTVYEPSLRLRATTIFNEITQYLQKPSHGVLKFSDISSYPSIYLTLSIYPSSYLADMIYLAVFLPISVYLTMWPPSHLLSPWYIPLYLSWNPVKLPGKFRGELDEGLKYTSEIVNKWNSCLSWKQEVWFESPLPTTKHFQVPC